MKKENQIVANEKSLMGGVKPKISIIIDFSNSQNFNQCITSLLSQTLKDIEVVCINASSAISDELHKLNQKDKRIKIISKIFSSQGEAKNFAIKAAEGKYLLFLSSNDFLKSSNSLKKAYNKIKKASSDVLLFDAEIYCQNNKLPTSLSLSSKLFPQKRTFSTKQISHFFYSVDGECYNKLFSKSFIDKKSISFQDLQSFEDTSFAYISMLEASKISCLSEILVCHRKDKPSNASANLASAFDCLTAIMNTLHKNNLYGWHERDFLNFSTHIILSTLRANNQPQTEGSTTLEKCVCELGIWRYLNHQDYFYDDEIYTELCHLLEGKDPTPKIDEDIEIVYATDENYAKYTLVSIWSAMKNSCKKYVYKFNLLIPPEFSVETKKLFEDVLKGFSNCKLNFMEIKQDFSAVHLNISHITTPAYYRLILPKLLPNAKKCLYLDGDTICCDDLAKLYTENISNYYIAGVEALGFYKAFSYHQRRLKRKNLYPYLNSGVLMMNLEEFRKGGTSKKLESLLNINYACQDQDMLNVVCEGKIKVLPYRYNCMPRHSTTLSQKFINKWVNRDIFDFAVKNPCVIHFSNKIKPWQEVNTNFDQIWQNYFNELNTINNLNI